MPNLDDQFYSSSLLGMAVTFGNLAIWIGLASAVTTVALYWVTMLRTMRQPAGEESAPRRAGSRAAATPEATTDRFNIWARRFYYLTSACVVIGAGCLMTLILGQQYTLEYVAKNSNQGLAFGYRFASFWSDQEGTFFLWALYNTVFGAFLLWRAKSDERWVMPFFTLINVSLFALLTFMNPFWLPDSHEVRTGLTEALNSAITAHQIDPSLMDKVLAYLPKSAWDHFLYYMGWAKYWKIPDGKGLNEQLQNFWMVIHPPTLFLGYSSMVIPSCFAMGALMRRDYDNWVNRAAPWLMFSWTVLGTGIFLGAYWAYETLGWGGYWSWDPVENSSLMPWLMGTTLIHGLLAQRNRGNLKQANLFLGVMTGAVVLLGSFLVRSGVLEGSVHSFATPQKSVYITLVAIMSIWFLLAVGIWIWRFSDIQSEIAYETTWERHFGFFLGLISLSAVTLVVMFGVFIIPVIVPLVMHQKPNVEFTFYNKSLLPVAFLIVLLMGLTPLMPWRRVRENDGPKAFATVMLWTAALIGVLFVIAGAWAAVGHFRDHNDFAYIVVGLGLAFALVSNVTYLVKAARGGGIYNIGPWLAHIGFLVIVGGILITSRFNATYGVQKLGVDQSAVDENGQKILGRDFIFRGKKVADDASDHDRMLIDMVTPDGKVTHLDPKFFVSKNAKQPNQVMTWPFIVHEWLSDVYVEPSAMDDTGAVLAKDLHKQDEMPTKLLVHYDKSQPEEAVYITLLDYDTSGIRGPKATNPPTLFADFKVTIDGVDQKVRAGMQMGSSEGPMPIPVKIQGLHQNSDYSLIFQLNQGEMTANVALIPDKKPGMQADFQVLYVPGIQVLWWGVYIMVAGGWLCFKRRRKLARRIPTAAARKPKPVEETPEAAAGAPRERELVGARLSKLRPKQQPAE